MWFPPLGLIKNLAKRAQHSYGYFRTGVEVEGRAWFCADDHTYVKLASLSQPRAQPVSQHIDVEVRFWNRRGDRVTVVDVDKAKVETRTFDLVSSSALPFKTATLEEGAAPEARHFALVRRDDPDGRVEAAAGETLQVYFRPSRGSEKFARPRVSMSIGVKQIK